MNSESSLSLSEVVKNLMASGKGILAADESVGTAEKRFVAEGIECSEENRRKWRELLLSAPGAEKYLSGVILYDETIRQSDNDGVSFPKLLSQRGIATGIKVDQKTSPFENSPQEEVTNGLEGLSDRLSEYAEMGAKFTKWRAVVRIGDNLPTEEAVRENARRMAKYAGLAQEKGMVPMVEPEVLLEGNHTLKRCEEVVRNTLGITFEELNKEGINLGGLILKTSMVLQGNKSGEKWGSKEIAEATMRSLLAKVPKETAGVVFLSGGQTPQQATENLNEIAKIAKNKDAPWPLTFSYSRAIQDPIMKAWAGKDENIERAQEIFLKRLKETAQASEGRYEVA
ncbi:MAG: class I fructose-bisphosphate aldolase [bacterium]|nr:class I fructose-bisphosphate aldolase [bacterium]